MIPALLPSISCSIGDQNPDVMTSFKGSNNVIIYVLSLNTIYILLPYLNITDLYKIHIYRSFSYEYTDKKKENNTYPLRI